jgi:DNA-binding CsgD family transcriptional regulator
VSVNPESLARGGLARIDELCRAQLDTHVFRRELRPLFERSLGFDGYCVNVTDPRTLVITSSVGDGLETASARRLFALERAGRDFNLLRELAVGPKCAASLSETTSGRVERSRRMRDIFLPLGYGDELRAALRVDGRCWGHLHLFRARGGRFDARDVAAVSRLTPRIAAALRDAVRRSLTHVRVEFAPVVVNAARRPGTACDQATEHVRRELDEVPGATVPHVVHQVATHAGTLRASATATSRTMAIGVGRSGAIVEFRPLALARQAAVLVDGARPAAFEQLLFAAARLSPRELEVATALVNGASNDELARTLSIGLFTAKDHVRAVFAKLGVGSRAELCGLARGNPVSRAES